MEESTGSSRWKSRRDEPLERLLRALGHPLRRRILGALAEDCGSASSLAKKLGAPLSNTSYHLNRVLADDCEVVELVESIPRRGAEEKVYVLNDREIAAALAAIPSAFPAWACPAARG
ncbi:MAG: winged helix-turn-helix domain-containing protein [Solirubrobacterales bacterium]